MDTLIYEKGRKFIYRNARPLDFAVFQYYFENGSKENVLRSLAEYQNSDGGFGNALESDSWNPNSSPIQTWAATEILRELNVLDISNPIVNGIIRYLSSKEAFDGNGWMRTVKSNNDYPHAPWWEFNESEYSGINPTAPLVGFILCTDKSDSEIYNTAKQIAKDIFANYMISDFQDMHTIACMISLYEYCQKAYIYDLFDDSELKTKLKNDVNNCICKDISKWGTEYVCKPSKFIKSRESLFYDDNIELVEYECEFIKNSQLKSGEWNISWRWNNYDREFAISENWWKSQIIISNLMYLKNFGQL